MDDPQQEHEDPQGGAGEEGSADTPPPVPDKDDDTPLGDTDQHSSADA